MHSVLHPFERLMPSLVLDALEGVGLRGDGRLTALSSYENRVYQVQLEDGGAVVAKFYRPGRWSDAQIQEEHDFAAALAAAEVSVVAPLQLHGASLHHADGFAFSVSPRRGGRTPELDDAEVLEWIGRYLARLHNVGAQQRFALRPQMNRARLGEEPLQWLLAHEMVPLDVRSRWREACENALELIAKTPILMRLEGQNDAEDGGIRWLRLHGDCHPGNILWTPADAAPGLGPGPHFVDLDDCCMGPAVQDLWMLVSGSRAQQTRQLGILVDGYEQLRAFDRRELALIEPLRTLRLIHYSAWLARRWDDPIFPANFSWFGSSDYWLGQVQMLQDQCEAMQEEPLLL